MRCTNTLIFDGWSSELFEGGIRIADGEVVEIDNVKAGGDDHTIDAAGRTVIPGLIDAHFHAHAISLNADVIEMTPLRYVALTAAGRLSAALSRGITTVRDVADGDAGLASAIAEGLLVSPRYLHTGAALSQTGGHGDPRSAQFDRCFHGGYSVEIVDGEDAVRLAAPERFRRGTHAIKMKTSGGVISLGDPVR